MKEKYHRLCNRHRWIPVVIVTALMALFLTIDVGFGQHFNLFPWVLAGLTILLSCFVGTSHGARLMNPTVLAMQNHCDPYPLLAETEDQLSYVKNRGSRQLLTINRAAALIELGQFEEALALLEALNIDAPVCLGLWRHVYYHNAALAALGCGQREKADIYRRQAQQQVAAVTHKPHKAIVESATLAIDIVMHLADGDYDAARRLLEQHQEPHHTLDRVHRAYQRGRVELAQGNLSAARLHFEFAVQYGGKLYLAEKAREKLEEMNTHE